MSGLDFALGNFAEPRGDTWARWQGGTRRWHRRRGRGSYAV